MADYDIQSIYDKMNSNNEGNWSNANASQLSNIYKNIEPSSFLDKTKEALSGGLNSVLSNFSDGRFTGLDSNQTGLLDTANLSGKPLYDALVNNELISKQNALGQFDFTGAFNTGLSAFNAFNQYNQQNDMMDMYKQDLSKKWADSDRRDQTRANWGSAFSNAKATV